MTNGRRLTDRECEMAAALRRKGMTYEEIAYSLGVCPKTALRRCRAARERGMECPEVKGPNEREFTGPSQRRCQRKADSRRCRRLARDRLLLDK